MVLNSSRSVEQSMQLEMDNNWSLEMVRRMMVVQCQAVGADLVGASAWLAPVCIRLYSCLCAIWYIAAIY